MKLTNFFSAFIRTSIKNDKHWHTYLFFLVLRFVLVFLPQIGYVHPDEFFQSTEVLLGDHFQLEHTRAWEFNNTFPLRSITIPYILIKIPFNFLEFISNYTSHYLRTDLINSYMFLVFPRFIMCILSLVNDWSLYNICNLYSLRHDIRLLAFGSSFTAIIFGTRTFSNSIEMAITSVLLYLVGECMIHSNTIIYKKEFLDDRYDQAKSTGEKVKIWKLKNSLPPHNYSRMAIISTLCVVGVFNRPTFLIFGAPLVFYWMFRGMGTRTITFIDFNMRMILFCLSALPALCVFILIDSLYFKHLTTGEIHMFDFSIKNFVFTPWNFIKYNIDPSKTAEHGIHPKYIHLLVNIPMLYNVLGVAAICSFGQMLYRFFQAEYQYLPRTQSIVGLMSAAIFAPLFILSLINHQEARFLIPFTFPIILLHSPKLITGFCTKYPFKEEHPHLRLFYDKILSSKQSSKVLLKIWYTINIALIIFYGFIHQAGVFPLTQHFAGIMKVKAPNVHVHLVTSHIYNMPLSFVNVPSSNVVYRSHETGQKYRRSKEFYLYEYGGLDIDRVLLKIKVILNSCEVKYKQTRVKSRLYLAIPASLSGNLNDAIYHMNSTKISYKLTKAFYPHISTEALPLNFNQHSCHLEPHLIGDSDPFRTCSINDHSKFSLFYVTKQLSLFVHQFGLALYRFDIHKNRA